MLVKIKDKNSFILNWSLFDTIMTWVMEEFTWLGFLQIIY